MAPVQWRDLPDGILDLIANKLIDSEIDLLRLRSVCSPWRSCLSPPPRRPLSFPIKIPPLHNPPEFVDFPGCSKSKAIGGYYNLHQITLYRLSSPHDPSNGWLFKASQTKSNTFSLLIPLSADTKMNYPPMTIPKHLNLLDYQISEISKSYELKGVNCDGFFGDIVVFGTIKKIIPLYNYVVDCDIVFLALDHNHEHVGNMSYYKIGDEKFTQIDTKDHKIHDVIFYDRKCYAVDTEGVLVYLDSKLELFVAASSPSNFRKGHTHALFLVKCDSDLYVASKAYGSDPEFFHQYIKEFELHIGFAVMLYKFNKCNGSLDCIEDLEDKVFLLSEDVSVGVSAKDYKGCKGNCVYVTDVCFGDRTKSEVYGFPALSYHLDTRIAVKMVTDEDSKKLHWPPPSWLMATASSSDP